MAGFTKLDSGIVNSSIWAETPETRVVWITLLAMCDKTGYARLSQSGLQRAANVPSESVKAALTVLESPDDDSRTEDNEGRRIRKIDGGWHILNYEAYRNNLIEEAAKEYLAQEKRKQRAFSKLVPTCLDKGGHVVDSSASASASASASGEGGKKSSSDSSVLKEIWDAWNTTAGISQCLVLSDKRRRLLQVRLGESFFTANWKAALQKISESKFCKGENDRGWKASFEWFIAPDSVTKLMEGKYDRSKNTKSNNPRLDGVYRDGTNYGEAAKRKLERQMDKIRNQTPSEVAGT